MHEIMVHVNQQRDTCSRSDLEQFLGVAQDRQPTISLSTTEVEYRAATMTAQENTWLIRLMPDLY